MKSSGFRSHAALNTAVFVVVPAAVGLTVKVIVSVTAFGIDPMSQVTVFPDRLHTPFVTAADTNAAKVATEFPLAEAGV